MFCNKKRYKTDYADYCQLDENQNGIFLLIYNKNGEYVRTLELDGRRKKWVENKTFSIVRYRERFDNFEREYYGITYRFRPKIFLKKVLDFFRIF